MVPPKGHVRPVAPVQVLPDHDRAFHFEPSDHEPDLDAIDEDHEEDHNTSLARRLSFDSSDESDSNFTSLADIIEGLPTAVKSLGPLRTIRRSASIRSWVSYFYEISASSMGTQISHEQHAEEHHHTLVSTSLTTTEVEMERQQQQQQQQQQHQPMNSKRRRASNAMRSSTKGQSSSSTELVEYVEPERRGIDRFCGIQGQLLVNNALSERRSSMSQGRADGDHANERRAYVQGLTWLLQGLPQDLDDHERQDLRRAMPPCLRGDMEDRDPRGSHRHRLGPSLGAGDDVGPGGSRSLIQRLVAALIVQLIVPMQFLWAYLVVLLGHAVYLERKYKVTEHVVKHSGELGYTMGKNGVKLSGVIYHNGGARVGAVVTDTVAYVADGVVKGISDGLREACLQWREDGER